VAKSGLTSEKMAGHTRLKLAVVSGYSGSHSPKSYLGVNSKDFLSMTFTDKIRELSGIFNAHSIKQIFNMICRQCSGGMTLNLPVQRT